MKIMSPPKLNPLTDVHCDCLNGVCKSCAETADLINRAKAAGFDVSAAEELNNKQLEIAIKTKQQFFPHKP
jgi:hypothetical protein